MINYTIYIKLEGKDVVIEHCMGFNYAMTVYNKAVDLATTLHVDCWMVDNNANKIIKSNF